MGGGEHDGGPGDGAPAAQLARRTGILCAERRRAKAIQAHLPDWLAVRDSAAAIHFFEGYGLPVPWSVWRQPLWTWTLFFLPFSDGERLPGRAVRDALGEARAAGVPACLAAARSVFTKATGPAAGPFEPCSHSVWPSRCFCHGFGVAHAYFPAIPCLPFYNDVSYLAAAPPWSVLRPLYLNLYPLLIGLTFLAPVDVTLSVWFFLLLNKLELLGAAATGWSEAASGGGAPSPPYLEEQSAGAYLALAAVLVWNARKHLAAILRSLALWNGKGGQTRNEPDARAFRLPAMGFLGGALGVLVWAQWTGLPLWFAIGFFGFYFAVALVLSRLMAESGISWLLAPILPDKLILSLTGTTAISQMALTRLVVHVQHLRDTRQMLTPAVFHAGRLREEGKIAPRAFYGLLLAALFLSFGIAIPAALGIFYHHGALSLTANSDGLMMSSSVIPTTAVNQLSSRLISPLKPSAPAAVAVCVGAIVTVALAGVRARFLWWPLNPLGYALTGTLQVGYANKMLLSILLGWLFKSLTLRFGGARGFRLLRGVALGLILGDLVMGGILKLLDALLGPSGYAIF